MKKLKFLSEHYICEECEKPFKTIRGLGTHIQLCHNGKEYFDKWLKEENDDNCLVCKKPTEFISTTQGYKNFCCKLHRTEHAAMERKKYNLKHYNVEYTWQRNDVKEKIKTSDLNNHGGVFSSSTQECKNKVKLTKLQRYGDENYVNSKKAKNTKKERYGDENYTNREKAAETNLKKYGNVSPLHGKKQIEKKISTWKKKYGVDSPLKCKEIYEKTFKTRMKIKQYKDTNLIYQGSYEYDFLEKFYPLYNDIENGLSICYTIDNKDHMYHSDFYIPSLNLVIEIKNSYLAKKDIDEINEKKKAVISNGYDFIMIIDKHYREFKKKYVNSKR